MSNTHRILTPLVAFDMPSIYFVHNQRVSLPKRMAKLQPKAITRLKQLELRCKESGGCLYLSDANRDWDAQEKAHIEWKTGVKSAYSPPPGCSAHQAGIAVDFDVKAIVDSMGYKRFWDIAHDIGWSFVIPEPNASLPESWHIEYRDVFFKNLWNKKNYKTAIWSEILSVGGRIDVKSSDDWIQYIQASLCGLGFDIGSVDGIMGSKTISGILELFRSADIPETDIDDKLKDYIVKVGFDVQQEFAKTIKDSV